ncbi:hypothetical protein ACLUEY_14765 [Vreelandella aquamarina]
MAGIKRAKAEEKAFGREKMINDQDVSQWRYSSNASIRATADHFGIFTASVKRACLAVKQSGS